MAVLTVAAAASAGTVGGAAWSLAGAVAGTAAGAVDEGALSTGAAAVRAATELADALVALAGSAAADCVERAETGVEVGTMEAAGPGDGLQAISRRTAQAARQTGRGIGSPP